CQMAELKTQVAVVADLRHGFDHRRIIRDGRREPEVVLHHIALPVPTELSGGMCVDLQFASGPGSVMDPPRTLAWFKGSIQTRLKGGGVNLGDHVQHVAIVVDYGAMILQGQRYASVLRVARHFPKCASSLAPDFMAGGVSPYFLPSAASNVVVRDAIAIRDARPGKKHPDDTNSKISGQSNLFPYHQQLCFEVLRNRTAEIIVGCQRDELDAF